PMRERTAEGILRMLGKRPAVADETPDSAAHAGSDVPFAVEERNMVSGVLRLADRHVHSIMTPRNDITWINLNDDPETIRQEITRTPHGFFPVCRGSLDEVVGIGRAKDMIADLIQQGSLNQNKLRPAINVHETVRMLDLIETLKTARGQLVIVINEFGAVEGLVTPIDVFEAIAGDFPDEDEMPDIIAAGDSKWIVDGGTDLHHFEQTLDIEGLPDDSDEYSTLAGYMLSQVGRLPEVGDKLKVSHGGHDFRLKVLELEGRRIAKVQVRRRPASEADSTQSADAA